MNNASLELGGDNWAAKDGNLLGYAVGDSSGKYVPNEFTFTRGSNLSATRVNADGYIEKGYENLLLQSNNFGTTWANSGTTETSGQSGYDGTNNAWLLSKSVSDGYVYQYISQSGVQCVSVYAKANAIGGIQIYVNAGTTRYQAFNLTNGTLIGSGNNIDAKIESVGNGWYRCSMALSDTITRVRFYPTTSAGDKTGSSGSIYIQDAMINQGLAALPYVESGASAAKAGILENEPRIDYSSSTASLLLEPQRTNELANSEYFEAGTLSNATLSISGTSLENVNNAYALTENTANAEHYWISEQMTTATNNNLVSTIFVKPNGRTKIRLWNYHLANQFGRVDVDLTNNTTSNGVGTNVTFVSANVTDYSNGWKRVEIQSIKSSSTYPYRIRVTILNDNGSDVYAGDGTSGVLIYGAQMEQDATYPTSYIPTYGTSQTRLEDEAPFPATFRFGTLGDGESGTIVVKTIANGLTSNNRFNFFSNGGSANWYWNGFNLYSQTTGGSRQFNLGSTASSNLGTEVKLCMRKSGDTLSCFFNGGDKGSINIGGETIRYFNDFSTYLISQSIVEFEEFPTALTDSECIELTTI